MSEEQNPTEEELRALPRHALVAFAVRCAMRVRPLFEATWTDAAAELSDSIDRAITAARESTATPGTSEQAAQTAQVAEEAAATVAAHVARSAAYASDAAVASLAAVTASAHSARAAAQHAESAAREHGYGDLAKSIRSDYSLLHAAAAEKEWTDLTTVTPDDCGPLWPDGVPTDWPSGE